MDINISRVRALRGNLGDGNRTVYPPWSVTESLFFDSCTRCNACIDVCPSNIIQRGSGGFPEVNFQRGECDFCGECAQSCQSGALHYSEAMAPWWNVVTIDTQRCLPEQGVMCLTCSEQCDVEAIQFKPTLGGISSPQLDTSLCTGCGACIAPCPGKAVEMITIGSSRQQLSIGERKA